MLPSITIKPLKNNLQGLFIYNCPLQLRARLQTRLFYDIFGKCREYMFRFLKNNKEPKDIKDILKEVQRLEKTIRGVGEGLENLKKESRLHIQKMGVVRFNPFPGAGGNQSFSIALLDANNDGVVVTSLYSRDGNRVYAKPVKNSSSDYSLAKEETEAISKAIGASQ